jgi:transcriptional regulator with XRE-family HTH domain
MAKNRPEGWRRIVTPTEAELAGRMSGKALRVARSVNSITQEHLAERAHVSRSLIAGIENGSVKFTENAGEAIWSALLEIIGEENWAVLEAAWKMPKIDMNAPGWSMQAFDFLNPQKMQQKRDEYIALLEKQVTTQAKLIEDLKELKGFEQITFLLGRMEKMEQQLADFARLNGLRTTEVVAKTEADELAERLEQELRKDSER